MTIDMMRTALRSLLLCTLGLGLGTAWAEPPGGAPDWGQLRRDVESQRRGGNGAFEARRQAIRERARARFDEADADGDGQLSREEVGRLRPLLAKHFDRIDANGDGLASEQELADALRRLQQMRRENFNRMRRRDPLR